MNSDTTGGKVAEGTGRNPYKSLTLTAFAEPRPPFLPSCPPLLPPFAMHFISQGVQLNATEPKWTLETADQTINPAAAVIRAL